MRMINLSNGLSFLRAPLAFLFLSENVQLRVLAIALAMITDSIDGYIARRQNVSSTFGAILDPACDKFFVYFGIAVFFFEGKIALWQALAMVSRDFFLSLFGLYLLLTNKWRGFKCHAVRFGKISTALQFIVLLALAVSLNIYSLLFYTFILLGVLAFFELLFPYFLKKDVKD